MGEESGKVREERKGKAVKWRGGNEKGKCSTKKGKAKGRWKGNG